MREKLAREVEFGRRMQVKERRRLDQEAEEQTKQLNAVISRRFMEDSARMDDREAASKASREAHVRSLREQMAARESNRMKYLEEERAERARLNAQWSEELLLNTRAKDEEVMEQRRMHAELLTANRERYWSRSKRVSVSGNVIGSWLNGRWNKRGLLKKIAFNRRNVASKKRKRCIVNIVKIC